MPQGMSQWACASSAGSRRFSSAKTRESIGDLLRNGLHAVEFTPESTVQTSPTAPGPMHPLLQQAFRHLARVPVAYALLAFLTARRIAVRGWSMYPSLPPLQPFLFHA